MFVVPFKVLNRNSRRSKELWEVCMHDGGTDRLSSDKTSVRPASRQLRPGSSLSPPILKLRFMRSPWAGALRHGARARVWSTMTPELGRLPQFYYQIQFAQLTSYHIVLLLLFLLYYCYFIYLKFLAFKSSLDLRYTICYLKTVNIDSFISIAFLSSFQIY